MRWLCNRINTTKMSKISRETEVGSDEIVAIELHLFFSLMEGRLL
jgi:hypothetical protein